MKKLTIVILLFLVVKVNAQWELLNNPTVGVQKQRTINVLASDDSTLIVDTDLGVFISNDNGNNWFQPMIWNTEPNGIVHFESASLFGHLIFVWVRDKSSQSTCYRSTDFGLTWSYINFPELNNSGVGEIYKKDGNFYKWNRLEYCYESTDNGATWNVHKTGTSNIWAKSIVVCDNLVFVGTEGQGMFVSSDNGKSWQSCNNGIPKFVPDKSKYDFLYSMISDGKKVIVSTAYGGLYETTDFGISWHAKSSILGDKSVVFHSNGKEIYTCNVGWNVTFKSTDQGENWTKLELPYKYGLLTLKGQTIFITPNGIGLGGLIYSNDGGLTWQQLNAFNYTTNTQITALDVSSDNIFIKSSDENIYYSTNNGNFWNSITLNIYTINSYVKPDTKKIKLRWSSFATSNGGTTWSNIQIPISNNIGTHGVFITTISDFDVCNDKIFLASNSGLLEYKGAMLSYNKLNSFSLGSITASNSNMFISTDIGIFRSFDCGLTFEKVLNINYYVKLYANKNLVIGCYKENGALWISFDNGISWKQKFLSITDIVDIAINDSYLFFVTKDKIWRTTHESILTSVAKEILPTNFSLSQNYPNPFNPSTTIDYQLSTPGFVTLKVYDLLGREVATLVNEYKQPGNYKATFNAGHLERSREMASGIYFYRLAAGTYSETKKLILMK